MAIVSLRIPPGGLKKFKDSAGAIVTTCNPLTGIRVGSSALVLLRVQDYNNDRMRASAPIISAGAEKSTMPKGTKLVSPEGGNDLKFGQNNE
jgi:hypothetical protein